MAVLAQITTISDGSRYLHPDVLYRIILYHYVF